MGRHRIHLATARPAVITCGGPFRHTDNIHERCARRRCGQLKFRRLAVGGSPLALLPQVDPHHKYAGQQRPCTIKKCCCIRAGLNFPAFRQAHTKAKASGAAYSLINWIHIFPGGHSGVTWQRTQRGDCRLPSAQTTTVVYPADSKMKNGNANIRNNVTAIGAINIAMQRADILKSV